jgi:hypothetical protein
MDANQTLQLLAELKKMGFGDAAFGRLHHKRENISGMEKYCEDNPERKFSGNNTLVYRRLAFVLNACKGLEIPTDRTGQIQLFNTLAEAAFNAIPPS